MAGGHPCSLVRFSGFDEREPERVTRYSEVRLADIGPAAEIWRLYTERLLAAHAQTTRGWGYVYDRFDNGVRIPLVARSLFRELGDSAERFGDPFCTNGTASFFEWLRRPVGGAHESGPAVTRLWDEVYRRRADLQRAFPDHLGADLDRFLDWTATSGASEHRVEERLAQSP